MSNANNESTPAPQDEVGAARARLDCCHATHAINTLDKLDSTIASLSMQVREAFDEHFQAVLPFLSNHSIYCKFALYASLQTDSVSASGPEQTELLDSHRQQVLHAAEQCRRDHWEETSKEPALYAAKVVIKLAEESETILGHINRFMPQIAPSFSEAGSMEKLVTWPASRLQILGAEEAFRRAKKTGSKMPKHGSIIYASEAVQLAPVEHRGTVARFLANKCILAARHDYFTNDTSAEFGRTLRRKVDKKVAQLKEASRLRQAAQLEKVERLNILWEFLAPEEVPIDETQPSEVGPVNMLDTDLDKADFFV
ncbi:hypothetical protein F4824DRAFT_509057 [Ustulina deusta]|nr:hypothetical protein F4824DRAFT_509057 [Ustulina deusta]